MITNIQIIYQFSPDLLSTFHILNFNPEEILFFDIETTGLNSKTSQVFLIGLVFFQADIKKWKLLQFLMEKNCEEEEKKVLKSFSSFIKNKLQIIHFNGNSFDIPYLISRFQKYQLDNPFSNKVSIDLYRKFLRIPAFFKQMPNHTQKAFEDLTNYPRKDLLSGKEMIKLYHAYIKMPSKEKKELLLQHNYDDLMGMLSIFPILNLEQLSNGAWKIKNIEELKKQELDQSMTKELLFTLSMPVPVPIQLSAAYSFGYMTVDKHTVKLKLPLYEGTLKFYYPDYKNYYYLPLEDEAMHKSIAIYTDTKHRQKATASTCYKKYNGLFIYAPSTSSFPLFKEDLHAKKTYTFWPFQNSSLSTQEHYIQEILKTAITLS